MLDNCESLIDICGPEFRELLSYFVDKCKMLKILVVSRNEFGKSDEFEALQPLILPQLSSKQAVVFFLDVLQQGKFTINNDEIVELIKNSPIYPISKVFKNEIPA